jgi:dienelactone hydrolase
MSPRLAFTAFLLIAAIASALASAQPDLSLPGPYPVGDRLVTISRATGTTFTARLYYPATAAGGGTPLASDGRPLPGISFGHGFLQTTDRYASTLRHLASHGYLVLASDSEGSIFPSHANFSSDLSTCLTYLQTQNGTSGSFLFGAVDPLRFGMCGHSMGGGCAILAATNDPRVKAIATLAAAETNPSATGALAGVDAPIRLIAGSADAIVSATTVNGVMYAAAGAPRQAAVIAGGFHCGFEDVSTIGCDTGALPRADQLSITRRLLTEWFNLYLKDDQTAWHACWGPERNGDPRVTISSDSGATLAPSMQTFNVVKGRPTSITLTLTNSTLPTTTFFGLLDGGAVVAPLANFPSLARGQSGPANFSFRVPIERPEMSLTTLATVLSSFDGGTRTYASLTLRLYCPADFDNGLGTGARAGGVGVEDLLYYLTLYGTGAAGADVDDGTDTGTQDGGVGIEDLLYYLVRYTAGC